LGINATGVMATALGVWGIPSSLAMDYGLRRRSRGDRRGNR